ncbi:NAD(P)/FAD-dependent oxidoreductase [Galbitalea sp. SE-J8]|uniref:phytoene desaturase family protein n=1 Tax=Galbitalea sp. SE-J8 TaxID=3054952 RepID=UPI00259CA8B3|nr:NAD(P)/FAD-dependent oxidoreductase [Galbitalea sp. SE-J8]MDM4761937.1 NAD(P)/FAD-dependent oxidoreductase [Galbitalea sp. SE-J8]
MERADAVVVGSGPNGLAAAVTLAHAGLAVRVLERNATIGGGARTRELTLPGFRHDVCSAIHPAAIQSPFFRAWGLTDRVAFAVPDVSFAHVLDDGRAVLALRSLDDTVAALGRDGVFWRSTFAPLVARAAGVTALTQNALLRVPRDPAAAASFALSTAIATAPGLGSGDAAALLSGVVAHALTRPPSLAGTAAGIGLALFGHTGGWPVPIGGSQAITDALAADLTAHGGVIETDAEVRSLADLEPARAVLLDTSPALLAADPRIPERYRRALRRFRRAPGVAKVDLALAGAVPWLDAALRSAPTVHLGGSASSVRRSETEVHAGRIPERPFVLVAQPSIVDPGRAPAGAHTLWAYLHVPAGSPDDPTERVLAALERAAPGVRDLVLAVSARTAIDIERDNPNDVGGDITGGAVSLRQLAARPVLAAEPWRTPLPGFYLASSSAAPGPGVHGMAGWHAARLALRDVFGIRDTPFATPPA